LNTPPGVIEFFRGAGKGLAILLSSSKTTIKESSGRIGATLLMKARENADKTDKEDNIPIHQMVEMRKSKTKKLE
jgi:hypothetical protein